MTPAHVVVPSPVGDLTVVADGGAVTHVRKDAAKHRPDAPEVFGDAGDLGEEPFASAVSQLAAYFSGSLTTFDLPLAPRGDAFHQRVSP
jgi:methylated-DNA-[protein]-cysteine S-methyltransferase